MAFESKYVRTVSSNKAELWRKLRTKLSHLDMELTERCNNDCVHCLINRPEHDAEALAAELTTAEIKDILKQAAALGCFKVRFTGGEPLLRPDFAEIYLYAKRLGLKVLLFTNATLIDNELIQLLKKYPPGEKVEVTVYGMTKESYESVSRAPGSFDAAFRGTDLLLKNNIPFVVKSAFLPQNQQDVETFESWAKTIPWMDKPPRYAMFLDLRSRHDSESRNARIQKLRVSPQEGLKLLTRDAESYKQGMRDFCEKFTRPPGDKLFACGAGHKSGTVDAYGRFQMCMLLRHPDFAYDLRSGTLEDALDNVFPKFLQTRALNNDYLQKCAKCFLKGVCEQCPAKSWSEHGTLDTPVSYLCEVTHAQARYLGLLEEGEFSWQVENWQERLDRFIRESQSK